MKKRIIAALTAAALALAPLGAFAADTSETEAALTAVKGKIDIPESYTEFSVNYYDYSDDVSYYFTWSNTDSTERLAVEADAKGRITYYSLDSNNDYYSDDVNLAQYSAADVREFAKTKLERIMPEAFGADDTLVVSSSNYSSGRNRYNVVFKREKNGEEVLYDYVEVVLGVNADGALYVKYVNISYNYDAEFETPTDEIADLSAAYQAVSPAELQYYIKYSYENGKTVKTADLHYVSRHKYMSVYSGEPIDVYYSDEVYADASASAEAGGSGNTLSDAEIAKLEEIGGLKSADEILSTAKGIEILGLSDDAAVKYSYIYEEGDGSYTISLSLTNGVYITADAKTGEILSIYNYHYDNAPNPDKNAATADAAREKIDAFLNEYSSKFGEYKEVGSEESDGSLSLGYVRYINDIPCYADNIYIRYDLESDELSSYRISYTDISFPSPDNIISADEAYNTILENGGLERQYICAAENDYKLCVTLANYYSAVDAFTGKIENESVQSEYSHDSYTDIDGHWCQAAVQILEQSGIAFNGNLLKPDEPITQSDLLRLVGAVIDGMTTETMTCDEETLYHRVDEIQPFFEDNTTAGVTRENACVYFARALGVAKYAADANMFKTAFSDADNISAEKVGYIALLASAGAINKNGAFRPQDYITYAEACTILYNILNIGL